ncbi:MAG: ribonuclease III domain-containing protein [Bacillota bacterium]|nr:ribonuclease III domain-containing protein [Bacillota bacterium]
MAKELLLKEFEDGISDTIYKYGAVQLAFIGDAVFDLYIRTKLLEDNLSLNPNKLHRENSSIVSANFQSKVIALLKDSLSESELAVFKWARNANGKSAPKSTTASNYRNATGFEALIGALFLQEKTERLEEIIGFAYRLKLREIHEKDSEKE